jgi:hypothetical protein
MMLAGRKPAAMSYDAVTVAPPFDERIFDGLGSQAPIVEAGVPGCVRR